MGQSHRDNPENLTT